MQDVGYDVPEFLDTRTVVEEASRNNPDASLYTGIMVTLCKVNNNSNGGGCICRKNLRRQRPIVKITGNSYEETSEIFNALMSAFGYDDEDKENDYEVHTNYRKEGESLTSTIDNYISSQEKDRANPSRKDKKLKGITKSIDQRNDSIMTKFERFHDDD